MNTLENRKIYIFLVAALAINITAVVNAKSSGSEDFASRRKRSSAKFENGAKDCLEQAKNAQADANGVKTAECTIELSGARKKAKTASEAKVRFTVKDDKIEGRVTAIEKCTKVGCDFSETVQGETVLKTVSDSDAIIAAVSKSHSESRIEVRNLTKERIEVAAKIEACKGTGDVDDFEDYDAEQQLDCFQTKLKDPDMSEKDQRKYFNKHIRPVITANLANDNAAGAKLLLTSFSDVITDKNLLAQNAVLMTSADVALAPTEFAHEQAELESRYQMALMQAGRNSEQRREVETAYQEQLQTLQQRQSERLLGLNTSLLTAQASVGTSLDPVMAKTLASARTALGTQVKTLATNRTQRDSRDRMDDEELAARRRIRKMGRLSRDGRGDYFREHRGEGTAVQFNKDFNRGVGPARPATQNGRVDRNSAPPAPNMNQNNLTPQQRAAQNAARIRAAQQQRARPNAI